MTDEKQDKPRAGARTPRHDASEERSGEQHQREVQEERDSREGGGEKARDEQHRDAEKHGREVRQGKRREDMTEQERQHEAEQAFKDAPPGYSPTARIGD
jgi:hypothetical protein